MSDKDSSTSRSSLPLLRDEDDDNDELVLFDEDDGVGEYDYDYGYDLGADELPPGYTRSELSQAVVFVKSSKDPTTGDFCRDRKELLWCLQNRCEEAAPGVWSGSWYFTYLLGEKEGRRAWVDSMNRRVVKELGGKAIQIDPDIYRGMLKEKDKGNRAFSRGQYKSALDCYLQAEKMMGGEVSGIYLVPNQRAEMVKVLSNQAECYLRMKKYEEAFIQATTALQLDKRHQKSMLRRAKAIIYSSERLNSMVAAQAAEDLQSIIEMKSPGSRVAQGLLKKIEVKVNASTRSQQ